MWPSAKGFQLKVWPSPHSVQTAAFRVLASNGWHVIHTRANPTHIPTEAFGWDCALKMNACLRIMFPTLVLSQSSSPWGLLWPAPSRQHIQCSLLRHWASCLVQSFLCSILLGGHSEMFLKVYRLILKRSLSMRGTISRNGFSCHRR